MLKPQDKKFKKKSQKNIKLMIMDTHNHNLYSKYEISKKKLP
jgi:ribosomal protein S17